MNSGFAILTVADGAANERHPVEDDRRFNLILVEDLRQDVEENCCREKRGDTKEEGLFAAR